MNLFCCFLLFVLLPSVAGEHTQFAFHSFPSEDDNIIALGDAAHSAANQSYVINRRASQPRGSCGALFYKEKVRIQDVATGRVASFNTSFSFTFESLGLPSDESSSPRDKDTNGVAFSLFRSSSMKLAHLQALMSEIGSDGICKCPLHPGDLDHRNTPSGVLIFFGMGNYSPGSPDFGNSYIRVSKNHNYEYDIRAYTHNLCSNNTFCSYFSDGKIFTAWIDFNSSTQTLEVWLANGSKLIVKKPLQPQLRIPNYKFPEMLGDKVIPTFWGTSNVQCNEVHELLSWEFFNSEISEVLSSQTPNHFWKAKPSASISIGIHGLVVPIAIVILWYTSRLAISSKKFRYTPLCPSVGPHVFSYVELRMVTNNFHERNLLGIGGSGFVYKGSFEASNGIHLVAIKQINISTPKQAESLFHAEVTSLGQIRHRNVVRLHGWCQDKGRLLLVYDFMPNGGLNEWLHKPSSHGLQHQKIVLSLQRRVSILQGVGAALEYLHEDCLSCILHRDIKSSNVLLDADFNAHLGDFGLARLMDHHKLDKTTLAAGTLGYMAPEMPYTGKATKESDVYSFGILVLEVVCARRPLDMQAIEPEDLVLLHTVWRAREGRSLFNVVDPRLLQTLHPLRSTPHQEDEIIDAIGPPPLPLDSNLGSENDVPSNSMFVNVDVQARATMVVDLLHLGLLCCLPNPKERPTVGQVNGILQQINNMENASTITNIAMPFLPATKPWGLYRSLEFSQTSSSLNSNSFPILETHIELLADNSSLKQAFGNLNKHD